MQLDVFVPFPRRAPVVGDNVLYSTAPFVDRTSGRPPEVGAVLSGERGARWVSGWFQADKDATVKFMGRDRAGGTWVVLNAASLAAPANTACTFKFELRGGGEFQVVANFAVAPTAWQFGDKVRLSIDAPST